MIRLLALLLVGVPLLGQTVAQSVEVVAVEEHAALVCAGSFSGSVTSWRITHSSDTTLGYYGHYPSDSADDCIMITGVDAGVTIHVRPEVDSGSGFDTSYDCGTDTPDLTPEQGSGSAACGGDGIIELTMATGTAISPTAPSGLTDYSAWTATSRSWAATCSEVDIETQMENCRTDTNDDSGDYDTITIPYNCDVEVDLTRRFSHTNPDACFLQSDRTGTAYCNRAGERPDALYVEECAPILRCSNLSGYCWVNSTGGVWGFEDIAFAGPDPSSTTYVEGRDISTAVDQGGDLRLTASDVHNITGSEDPPYVVVAGCKDSSGNFTALNGVHDYTAPSTTQIDLTGEAGGDCTSGGVVVNDVQEITGVINNNAGSTVVLRRVVLQIGFPWRFQFGVVNSGDDGWFSEMFVDYGNWVMNTDGSTLDAGAEYSNNMIGVAGIALSNGSSSRNTYRNILFHGAGVFAFGNDTSPSTVPTDIDADKLWSFSPDYLLSTGTNSGSDGRDALAIPCRHALMEFKLVQELDGRGFLTSGSWNCAGSSNTMNWAYYLRNNPSGSNNAANGTTDVFLRSLVVHDGPHVLAIEGFNYAHGLKTNIKGTFDISNVLGNRLTGNRVEVGEDNFDKGGNLLRATFEFQKLSFTNFTNYKPDDQPSFYAGRFRCGRCEFEDGLLLGEPRSDEGSILWTSFGQGGTNQSPDPDNEEAGDMFAAFSVTAEGDSGTADSFFRDFVVVGGCESVGCDMDTATGDANRVTDTEVTAECSTDTANYDMPDCQNEYTGSNTIAQDIDACINSDFSQKAGCAGSGDEGYDPDQGDQDLGIIRPYTGNTHPVELTSPSPTSFRIRYRMFSTTDQCSIKYRPNTGGAWTRTTDTTGARDRSVDITGLTAGQQYDIELNCENSPIGPIRTQKAPGSS